MPCLGLNPTFATPWALWAATPRGRTTRAGPPSSVSWRTSRECLTSGLSSSLMTRHLPILRRTWTRGGVRTPPSCSAIGYTFVLASGFVSWVSKLQPCGTASSTEAEVEYFSLLHTLKEAPQASYTPIELFGVTHVAVLCRASSTRSFTLALGTFAWQSRTTLS